MNQKWNARYSREEFAYGEKPNNYLKEQLPKLPVGNILFPAEGEGRNAVYAASLGWKVSAFDQSEEGKKKAMHLCNKQNVSINYEVGEFQAITFAPDSFDAIALIYAHFPADKKSDYHKTLSTYLRPGGIIIFEAFSKNHLSYNSKNEKVGGPRNSDELLSTEEIKSDFSNFEIMELAEVEIELNEGLYHIGKGSVIRFVGRKA
jgi:2-polyprenyl-3-methyl-5-hydroxy-6-metoxy-1,4-benzoquinol methylase